MSRHRRFILPGQAQHVIQRGINRDVIFQGEQDYRFYLKALKQASRKNHCRICACVF